MVYSETQKRASFGSYEPPSFVLLQAKEACGLESLARPTAESIKFTPFHFCNLRDNVTIAS